ncbi:hypothetical protein [Brucella gallinifaecis]|uniref:hypothetical protein n=1 Tax=Brucella gallinifaecis TaxID=215590 RepID=UPI00236090A2|nr:hypothetical protein [Brucella gallinifaecis]
MLSPKYNDDYPGRKADCEDAVSAGITDLIEQATLAGRSEEEAKAVIEGTTVPGTRDLIAEAVEAGWSAEEAADAIKVVSDKLQRGPIGRELDN